MEDVRWSKERLLIGIGIATIVSIAVSVATAPVVIEYFRTRGVGSLANPDRPVTHLAKAGTPDVGGVIILVAATAGYAAAHVRLYPSGIELRAVALPGLFVLAAAWGMGLVGAVDDAIKNLRRDPRGLSKRKKMLGTLVVGGGLSYAGVHWAGVEPRLSFVGSDLGPALPLVVFCAWMLFVIVGTSHGVNFTDGLDGLAGGNAAMILFVFTIVSFWQYRHPGVYEPLAGAGHLDVAIASAALFGACVGFLWWNAPPARLTMGDSGALALGGSIAALAFVTRTQLLLPILGGLFVVETATSWIQTQTINRYGKRFFRKAPIHHHFEEAGWPEVTVLTRFWIIAAILAGLGLAVFYNAFLHASGPLL